MIHAHDVINFEIIEGVQKIFARDHFELDQNKIISIIFLASLDQNTDVQCVDSQKSLSEGQEIDIRSKFFRGGPFGEFWLEVFIFGLLLLIMESERRSITF